MPSFTGDAFIQPRHFTGDAWIVGDRALHHRQRDHFGAESDLYVVIAERIGPYVEYTPIHYILEDMLARIYQLENYDRKHGQFVGDAYIDTRMFTGDAIIFKPGNEGQFTGDAWIKRGGQFTGDAQIQLLFTGDAYIIRPPA